MLKQLLIFTGRRLYFYPDGDKERYGEGYISLYVSIEDTSALQLGWEIDANVRFFVYDQIRDEYLMFQGCGFSQPFPIVLIFLASA